MSPDKIRSTANEIADVVIAKNKAYGDTSLRSAEMLSLLYPTGVSPEDYPYMLLIVRMFDKMARIATDISALEESPFIDIAGYAILGAVQSVGESDDQA